MFVGGWNSSEMDTIDYVNIDTTGNAIDFGNLTRTRSESGGFANRTRGLAAGAPIPGSDNTIDFWTISSTGNAQDFGDLLAATGNAQNISGFANQTRGVFTGGNATPGGRENKIQYLTIASTGNTQEFGSLSSAISGAGSGMGVTDDLSAFQNAVKFINPRVAHLEATTSHVDEGESGTTRLLHDLVWNDNISEIESSGLFLEVKRGNSLDIGMFHNQVNQSRQQATLEFWYYLPHRPEEVVLVRRSLYIQNGEDIESLCNKSDIKNMIWELVVLPSGHLEFRCCGGDSINTLSIVNHENHHETSKAFAGDSSDDEEDIGLVSWAREDGY